MWRDAIVVTLIAACWAMAVGCPPDPKPDVIPPPAPAPAPPAPAPPGPGQDGCAATCIRLAELGCVGAHGSPGRDDVYGTPDDEPCAVTCRGVQAAGISLATDCIGRANSCAAVDKCMGAPE